MSDQFNPENMPLLSLNTMRINRYEASRFLDSVEAIAAYLAESMKANDTKDLTHVLVEVAKANDVKRRGNGQQLRRY